MILLGIEDADGEDDIDWLCRKIVALRIFDDSDGVMNLPITDVEGSGILLVSQFTLMASYKKGNRPSWIRAARHEHAIPMYEMFVEKLTRINSLHVETGQFGADMQVSLVNDGPVTICMDTKNKE